MKRRSTLRYFLLSQLGVVAALCGSYLMSPAGSHHGLTGSRPIGAPVVALERNRPIRIGPLYDDPDVVSSEQLRHVLSRVRPSFANTRLRPNVIEHAVRTWGIDCEFNDPATISGPQMLRFLVDHETHAAQLGLDVGKTEPWLQKRPAGVAVRWGDRDNASVHHDHWLACLSEAGVSLDQPLRTPGADRGLTIHDALQESLRDFRLDENQVEWSAMTFSMWLPPQRHWTTSEGRVVSFDLLAQRLVRGHKEFGSCGGTHRVYSLVMLLRIDEEYKLLSAPVREQIRMYLLTVRDLITAAQFVDGYWSSNWSAGSRAVMTPIEEPAYKRVIATGHHLEWLALAPSEFHPPRRVVIRAAQWCLNHLAEQSDEDVLLHYTYYSHVANALTLWRGSQPADVWQKSQISDK